MVDQDQVARYTNYALFASLTLRLLDKLMNGFANRGAEDDDGGGIPELAKLLQASRNGAARISRADTPADLIPHASPREEISDYFLIKQLRPDLRAPADIRKWAGDAAELLTTIEDIPWDKVPEEKQRWVKHEIVPFLEALVELDGVARYDADEETDREAIGA